MTDSAHDGLEESHCGKLGQAGSEVGGSASSPARSEPGDVCERSIASASDREDSFSNESPSLTVITPTIQGREDLLYDCIQSVEAQTIQVAHLVGLDHLREGPAVIRNRLVEQVETNWILFLDDDDLIDSDYIETVLPFFDSSDLVYTWCRKNFDYTTDIPFDGPALRERNVIPVTACLRVNAFRAVGGFSSDVAYEDWSLWLKLLDIGARFTCIEERKWEYRRLSDGRDADNIEKLAQGKLKQI